MGYIAELVLPEPIAPVIIMLVNSADSEKVISPIVTSRAGWGISSFFWGYINFEKANDAGSKKEIHAMSINTSRHALLAY